MNQRFILAFAAVLFTGATVSAQTSLKKPPPGERQFPGTKLSPPPGAPSAPPADPPPGGTASQSSSKNMRGFGAGNFELELDGVSAGRVSSLEGGFPYTEVVTEKVGPTHIAKKHIVGVKYEPITVTCGPGMSKGFYDWIKDTLGLKFARKNGAIVEADYNFKEASRDTFQNALITEVTFPALDGASKDSAKLMVKITPELIRAAQPGAGAAKPAGDASKQKKWLPSNFRLKIDGLDEDLARVNKVEAITVKVKTSESAVGETRDYQKEPGSLEVSNLVFSLPEQHSQKLQAWFDDFVVKGNCGDDKEKSGTLEYLAPDQKEVLFTLTFKNLGIVRIEPDKLESRNENIHRVTVTCYCEQVSFDVK